MAFGERLGRRSDYQLGALALFLAAFTILTALGFQYIGGYVPCMLCYMERYAYYASIPVLFLALVLTAGGYRSIAAALFFLVAIAFLANTGLGVYHAGAEWKFWRGPRHAAAGSRWQARRAIFSTIFSTSKSLSATRRHCASSAFRLPAGTWSLRSC